MRTYKDTLLNTQRGRNLQFLQLHITMGTMDKEMAMCDKQRYYYGVDEMTNEEMAGQFWVLGGRQAILGPTDDKVSLDFLRVSCSSSLVFYK